MTDEPKAAKARGGKSFLERVVPWPESEDAPGFVGMHYATPRSDGKKYWVGKPFKTLAEFSRQLWSWYVPNNETSDFYFCTSMQKTATTNNKGKPKASRLQSNVACLKSFWADIDVGKKDAYRAGHRDGVKPLSDPQKSVLSARGTSVSSLE
jgi:hypothetical protein